MAEITIDESWRQIRALVDRAEQAVNERCWGEAVERWRAVLDHPCAHHQVVDYEILDDIHQAWRQAGRYEDAIAAKREAIATRMVQPLRVLLAAVGDGVKLTAAGYLPPKIVVTIFEELGLGEEWIGKGNREDLTLPVLELREAAQRLGLLRKYKGKLLPTARARKLADDPVDLWWHLAGRLPLGDRKPSDVEWQAGVLLLALMASGETDDAEVWIARLLSGMGWALEGGVPVDRRAAVGLIADDVHLLHRVGALGRARGGGWPGTVTTGGTALARAALADQRP